MRAYTRLNKRGFTLVELMIVVAIIGVLAALAIYGVRRYLATAKTSEAKNTIGTIARGAAAAYERENAGVELLGEGATSSTANHALCESASAVPAAITSVKGVKYQPNSAAGADFETGDGMTGWKCLKFTINSPIYYQYVYTKGASIIATGTAASNASGFEAGAQGDLDADGILSQFARTGDVNTATGTLRLSTQVYVFNEFE